MKDFEADNFDVAMGGISITLDRQKKGMFSTPIMREGKTPRGRGGEAEKYQTMADIKKAATGIMENPGATNEGSARAKEKTADIKVFGDNVAIFDEIAKGNADLMMTDSSETRYQQKLHPGVLCAVHPEKPFDFAEKAYWLQRDAALKAFVDQWLHIAVEDGSFKKIYAAWFESIRIAGRFRYRASTITAGDEQSARVTIRTATVSANRRPSRRKSILRHPLQAPRRPNRLLRQRTLHPRLQPPPRTLHQRIRRP